MARRRTPPGLDKARREAREDLKFRGSHDKDLRGPLEDILGPATPAEDLHEEIGTAFARPPAETRPWGGKNDGTPGCLRSKTPLRRAIYVSGPGCPWCGCLEFRQLPPDRNYPDGGRKICLRCHPPERRKP